MTSLATVIGLVPMALKLGTGSESYAPLARALVGGLSVSGLCTVFVVPAAFLLAFFGFGAKAGMLPLHVWLPEAHPAAPSPGDEEDEEPT